MKGEEEKRTEIKKKSALKARDAFDFDKLVRKTPWFLPCTYEETLEEVAFTYDMAGRKNVRELAREDRKVQYRFLVNFRCLEEAVKEYRIPLAEDNVYYDRNYLPFIKERDLYGKGEQMQPEEFLFFYKTFIGGILGKKYKISTLQESGIEVLKKEPSFGAFYEAGSTGELEELLLFREEAYEKDEKEKTIRVRKSSYRRRSLLSILTPLLLLVCLVGIFYMGRIVIPFQKSVIAASESYVAGDYVACIDSMREISPEKMDASMRYMVAVSYARSESLKKEEIEGIVSRLSTASNEKELKYWIHLGRLECVKAQELAQALSNDQLLIYAYMKELDQLEKDTSAEGEEKQSRIAALKENIKTLGEKYTSEEEEEAETMKDTAKDKESK